MNRFLSLAAAIAIIAAPPAFAAEAKLVNPLEGAYDRAQAPIQQPQESGQFNFKAADVNADGEISRTEKRRYFNDIEKANRKEYSRGDAAVETSKAKAEYARADRDGNGKLTVGEYKEYRHRQASERNDGKIILRHRPDKL
jgi:hypothetical protein